MNSLQGNNYIQEMVWGSNFSYILSDNDAFLPTEYKVLQNQADAVFIKCMKTLYNGRVQLFYLTNELKPFISMLSSLNGDSFQAILVNLFSNILDVKNNGFLSCQNIDISFDKIYVDPATYRVSLVYLPLSRKLHDSASGFEDELRTGLVKLISEVPSLYSAKTMLLSANLSDGTLTMEDLCSRMKGEKGVNAIPSGSGYLRLVSMNAPVRIEIPVTKDDFVIGKKVGFCDGIIGFSNLISRTHCRISRRGAQITVTDLQSANGTFLNGVRLYPNQAYLLRPGDILRLANSDFQVNGGN